MGQVELFAVWLAVVFAVSLGRLLQQYSSHKCSGRGQQPFRAIKLDGLPVYEVLGGEQSDQQSPRDAPDAQDESDERGRRKPHPALDFMEVQVAKPGRKPNPLPGLVNPGLVNPGLGDIALIRAAPY